MSSFSKWISSPFSFRLRKPLKYIKLSDCKNFSLDGLKIKCKVLNVTGINTVVLGFYYLGKYFKKNCYLSNVNYSEKKKEKEGEVEILKFLDDLVLYKIVKVQFLTIDNSDGKQFVKLFLKRKSLWYKEYLSVNELLLEKIHNINFKLENEQEEEEEKNDNRKKKKKDEDDNDSVETIELSEGKVIEIR